MNAICVKIYFIFDLSQRKFKCVFNLDGDYEKSVTFYQSAVEKLRVYCHTLSNPLEKKRGNEVYK